VAVIDGAQHRGAGEDGDGGSVMMLKRGWSTAAAKETLASLMPHEDKTNTAHVGQRG
jgi:hypothetical protein